MSSLYSQPSNMINLDKDFLKNLKEWLYWGEVDSV